MNQGAGADEDHRAPRLLGSWWAVAAAVASPLVLAIVLLTQRPWAPVLDMAMTELRVRDVGGRHTPLIGLPGRIGNFPDQGSHPGPASFYLLAPFYRLSGARAWGLELGSVVINSAAVGLLLWIGRRRAGWKGVLALGVLAAIAVRGYGLTVLTHPWNPYFPVLLWMVVLVATWSVLVGDHAMAVVVVVVGSIAAQTHVPYLLNAVAMCAVALGAMAWRMRRPDRRSDVVRPLVIAVAAGAVLWLPAFVDQLIRDPGNIRMLVRHFASEPPEPAIGLAEGVRVFFRHLDAPSALGGLFLHGDSFVHRSGLTTSSPLLGVVVFVVWLAAAVIAYRARHTSLNALNLVIAVALAAGAFSMVRIFGKVWYYLTLWAWGTMLMLLLSVAWTIWGQVRRRLDERSADDAGTDDRRLRAALIGSGAAAITVCTVMSIGAAIVHEVPEHQLSDGLRAVLPATKEALSDGVGPAVGRDGRYLVFWQDSVFIGAQGYGLVNELERDGFEVGVHETWRVPVTPHRVFPHGTYDAEVHFVSGQFIDEWRQRPDYVEVVSRDVRSDDERKRFEELRSQVRERLIELDREDLLDTLDGNLFGASLDPDLPLDVIDDMSEMLLLGQPVAVFLAPPDSTM